MVAGVPDSELLTTLFSAAYHGKLDIVKSIVKDKGVSADAADAVKVRMICHDLCFGKSVWFLVTALARVPLLSGTTLSLLRSISRCYRSKLSFTFLPRGICVALPWLLRPPWCTLSDMSFET